MWILPKNYPLSSHFAQGMVASKEDLSLPGLNIESSLMWRSKPMRLPTCLRKWKRDYWFQRLCIAILLPSHRSSFEEKLTLSLVDIRANHFQFPENEKDLNQKQDISGGISGDTLQQLDLIESSLKMSKVTSRLDCPQLLPTWKKMITEQRGEYSQRVKLAHHTNESASSSWPTATVFDVTGGSYPTELVNGQWRSKHSKDPNSPWYGAKLKDAVEAAEVKWPTPTATENGPGTDRNNPNYGQLGLANHPDVHGTTVQRAPMQKDRLGQPGQDQSNTSGKSQESFGKLNPNWVEQLMGLPIGWTDLGSWGTAWSLKQPQKHGGS